MHGEISYGCFCKGEDDARTTHVGEVNISDVQISYGRCGRGVGRSEALVVGATVVLAEPENADRIVTVDVLEGEWMDGSIRRGQ